MQNTETKPNEMLATDAALYIRGQLKRGSGGTPIDAWLPDWRSRTGIDQEKLPLDTALEIIRHQMSELTEWQPYESDEWGLCRYTALHSRVLAVARLDFIRLTWAAYIVHVPGKRHEDEVWLWRDNGVKLEPRVADAIFWCPWMRYRD